MQGMLIKKGFGFRLVLFALVGMMVVTSLPFEPHIAKASSASLSVAPNAEKKTEITEASTYRDVLSTYDPKTLYQQRDQISFGYDQIIDGTKTNMKVDGKTVSTYPYEIENGKKVLKWDSENLAYYVWEFEVPETGYYEIAFNYKPIENTLSYITRNLKIDGKVPFLEGSAVKLDRLFKDDLEVDYAPDVNMLEDHIRPEQKELISWYKKAFEDYDSIYPYALIFNIAKGKHTLRLDYVDEYAYFGDIVLRSPKEVPTYEEYKEKYKDEKPATQTVKWEAELQVIRKSDPTVRRENDADPKVSTIVPDADKKPVEIGFTASRRLLNVIGGVRWKQGGQYITWKVEVPETGLYQLNTRYLPYMSNDGLPVYRQILIDNQVPFQEVSAYRYNFSLSWEMDSLCDKGGTPFSFYLTKGSHEISMKVVMGEYEQLMYQLQGDMDELSKLLLDITLITGSDPDPNYNYELENKIPALGIRMQNISNAMKDRYDYLRGISQKLPSMANRFKVLETQFQQMIEDPMMITRDLGSLQDGLKSLGEQYLALRYQRLTLDRLQLAPSNIVVEPENADFFESLISSVESFFISFTRDYSNIQPKRKEGDKTPEKSINVWIGHQKEQSEMVMEMVNRDFTPKTGIGVNMNILPRAQLNAGAINALLLAIAADKQPDVAIGMDPSSPVEFAIRDAAYNLKSFKDFDDVAKNFIKRILIEYEYKGGVYGLPEIMNFKIMIYRKDIVEKYNIPLPSTFDELYNFTLPVLRQNNMQFFVPNLPANVSLAADPFYNAFLFQLGGEIFSPDRTKVRLDEPFAYQAFNEYCSLYTHWGIPVQANFYNRFRTGEMPMGIESAQTYIQLLVAAPELVGKVGIALAPGHARMGDDPSTEQIENQNNIFIDRTYSGLAGASMVILNKSKKHKESWEFIKWWTSVDVQTNFSKENEALMGPAGRWNSSTIEAFEKMPWGQQNLKIIKKQLDFATAIPVTPGSYFYVRHVNNAWNRVVVQKDNPMNPRDSLEKAITDINKEIVHKRQEFSLNITEPPYEPIPSVPTIVLPHDFYDSPLMEPKPANWVNPKKKIQS